MWNQTVNHQIRSPTSQKSLTPNHSATEELYEKGHDMNSLGCAESITKQIHISELDSTTNMEVEQIGCLLFYDLATPKVIRTGTDL